ncbi:SGNH/GDSL hydrolase family protein [Planctomycetales bacterium ZRK34]|nr:SGNH/GDSL hydrolase family protein [Planctomycetales bacterium ZRK34]
MKRPHLPHLLTPLLIALLLAAPARAELFNDGETVVFLGDSITHGRQYHSMVYAYYLTRFPAREIHFVNAGVAGDSAGGAYGRLEEDVISKSPTTIVVMLGMNDVGRGNYVANPTEKQLEYQAGALDRYQKNMDKLLARLSKDTSARFILLTPSPFDQTAVNDRDNNQPGCNDGLGQCAAMVRNLAAKYNAQVIDLHGPMTALNLKLQKDDPAYTLIGSDRVHPGAPGNLMMAWLFLKAQGAPAMVSNITFDADAGKVTDADNAAVTDVKKHDAGWTFTVLEKALPYPVDGNARPMLENIPLEKTLNQQIITIKGLADGSHELLIDDEPVAVHTAAEWAAGVNLAFNEKTPQYKQAQEVAKLNESRRHTEVKLRDYAAVRWFLRHRRVDPDDMAAVKAYHVSLGGKTGYFENKVPTYLTEWPQRQPVIEKVSALEHEAMQRRTPRSHVYTLRPATTK